MTIRIATHSDLEAWVDLRARLWDGTSRDVHRQEAAAMLAKSPSNAITFLKIEEGSGIRAFAEVTMRHDHVNGCDTSPVAFLEGIYVSPDLRGRSIGRSLLASVRSWAQERGCSELASDADLRNVASHAFHKAAGFEETARVVYFRKLL